MFCYVCVALAHDALCFVTNIKMLELLGSERGKARRLSGLFRTLRITRCLAPTVSFPLPPPPPLRLTLLCSRASLYRPGPVPGGSRGEAAAGQCGMRGCWERAC